jgi:hypothetical protein
MKKFAIMVVTYKRAEMAHNLYRADIRLQNGMALKFASKS